MGRCSSRTFFLCPSSPPQMFGSWSCLSVTKASDSVKRKASALEEVKRRPSIESDASDEPPAQEENAEEEKTEKVIFESRRRLSGVPRIYSVDDVPFDGLAAVRLL